MKNMIRKIIERIWPELASGTHLPLLAAVVAVPDPPAGGERCEENRPRYAVDVRLLLPNGQIDEKMPVIRDVPVAMPAAAPDRGFAALPLPGTIVEIAFAFGMQSKPFVRSILPYNIKLPTIDDQAMRWQQSGASFQEVDRAGNWKRTTDADIADTAQKCSTVAGASYSVTSPQIWIGNQANNSLVLLSSFMAAVISALTTLAEHTHNGSPAPDQSGAISAQATTSTGLKTTLDVFTSTVNSIGGEE